MKRSVLHKLGILFRLIFTIGFVFVLQFPFINAQAQPNNIPNIIMETDEQIGHNPETGIVSFIGGGAPIPMGTSRLRSRISQDRAQPILASYAPQFGLDKPDQDLLLTSKRTDDNGDEVNRYQQTYQGVPVLAGELIVNMNQNGDLLSISGEVSQNPVLDTNPVIASDEASQSALGSIEKWNQVEASVLIVSQPVLMIFDESLLSVSTRTPELVWQLRVSSAIDQPIREVFLINAQTGATSLHYSEIDSIGKVIIHKPVQANPTISTRVSPVLGNPDIRTYTMSGSSNNASLPGTFVCSLANTGCSNGTNTDADQAEKYALDTYNFYATHHQRDSINNAGMAIISSVHYGVSYQNAFWNGSQMVYGDGFTAEDVVGHELTHGVTDYTSQLVYYYQAGAINESFSDIWGEFIDQENNPGKSAANKWLIGDALPIGAIRSMKDPTVYHDPDKMSSSYFYTGTGDNGGVHYNSSVNNKAAFLMVEGGSFNGQTISGIGMTKTAAVYYRVQTQFLGAGANYTDLYYALKQACLSLVGGTDGITSNDCLQVRNAALAVEMNVKPSQSFTPNPELCPTTGQKPASSYLFQDDMESGSTKWTFGATTGYTNDWRIATPGLSSPTHLLYGPGEIVPNDSYAAMSNFVTLPGAATPAYLYFNHFFDFEVNNTGLSAYDGGVLEYSLNGSTWVDASGLSKAGQDYTLPISATSGNPLGGRQAFAGTSHGAVTSRYNLSSLAGQSVKFRWRTGTDTGTQLTGWLVDDVRIYTCISQITISGTAGINTSLTRTSSVNSIQVTAGGTGYASAPTVNFTGGAGSGAAATAIVLNGVITEVSVTNAGTGYTSAPIVSFTGAGGSGATATALLEGLANTVNTDGFGDYSLVVPSNWSGIITPTRAGIVFTPTTRPYTNVVADLIGQDFTRQPATFTDVPFTYSESLGGVSYNLFPYVQALYNAGFTAGCNATGPLYCPANTLTRAESAVFMLRSVNGGGYSPPASPNYQTAFLSEDWSTWTGGKKWAEEMYYEGLTAGCLSSPLKFCPWDNLPRDQAVVFTLRIKYGNTYGKAGGTPVPAATGTIFADMTDTGNLYTKWAEKAYADNLIIACGTQGGKPLFCPSTLVDRAWAAYMIVKAKGLTPVPYP